MKKNRSSWLVDFVLKDRISPNPLFRVKNMNLKEFEKSLKDLKKKVG